MTPDERMAQDPGMFPGIRSREYGFEPSAEEMDRRREAARYETNVFMTGYQALTFDLSDKLQVEEYRRVRVKIYDKVKLGELVIHMLKHQWCPTSEKWLVHLEYSEYRFEKKDLLDENKKDGGNEEDKPALA